MIKRGAAKENENRNEDEEKAQEKKKNKKLPKGKTLENLHIFANFKAKISLF